MTRLLAMLLALSVAGCSFFMRTNPKSWEPSQKPTCSQGSPAEAGGSLGALLYAPATLYLLMGISKDCEDKSFDEDHDQLRNGWKYCLVGGTLASLGTLLFVDNLRASRRAVRCRNDWRRHDAWLALTPAQRSSYREALQVEQREGPRSPHEERSLEATPGTTADGDHDRTVGREQREKQERCREVIDAWRKEPAGSRALLWETMPPHCQREVPPDERPKP